MIPFVSGSDTSRAAAASFTPADLGRDERAVLDLLRIAGDDGFTDDELEVESGLRHQTVSARRNGLVRKGIVRDSGRRRETRSGRRAVVWVLGEGRPVDRAPNARSKRPSDAEIAAANDQIGAMVAVFGQESAELQRLRAWLREITG